MEAGQIKLPVFDWDGTLADSEAQIVDAMQSAIRQLQYQSRSKAQIRDVIGLGLGEAAQALFPELERENRELISNCYRLHYAKCAHETSLFPDVAETLHLLRQRVYKMAIATGKSRKGLDHSLQQTGLAGFFMPHAAPARPAPNRIRRCCMKYWRHWTSGLSRRP